MHPYRTGKEHHAPRVRELLRLLTALFLVLGVVSGVPALADTIEKVVVEGSEEMGQQGVPPAEQMPEMRRLLAGWLHLLDKENNDDLTNVSVLAFAPQVPSDLVRVLRPAQPLAVVWRTLVALVFAVLVMVVLRRLAPKFFICQTSIRQEQMDKASRLWSACLAALPKFAELVILCLAVTLAFLFISRSIAVEGRMVFQMLTGVLLAYLAVRLIGRLLLVEANLLGRSDKESDQLTQPLYHAATISFWLILAGGLFVNLFRELGARPQTISWIAVLVGSVVLLIIGFLVLYLRVPVSQNLLKEAGPEPTPLKQQFAEYWHLPAIFYLLAVWLIWIGQEFSGGITGNALIPSLFAVPFYLILSHLGRGLICSVVESMGLGIVRLPSNNPKDPGEIDWQLSKSNQEELTVKTSTIFRLLLGASLVTWLLSLWGVNLPFAAHAVRAIFQSLVTLALALICWRLASGYIEKKLAESEPEQRQIEEETDDEFGSSAPRGRSHTLLPMLRKVIGTVLVLMVILIVLSALGVNIGPLLAGAGVVGLAVGFGAQKLVSDVFSGFFFLLDDAFRVGEYIQAGSIRGTVEAITLRNVMLRHHMGMLQVVPHSDLGAITNFMRGGMVIKFPLEFPYDTDIDKVRKIIKKVGIEMLADETLADDFLAPLKSQGVHEITNSVMVIRVKFTAKPGKQFVIKREAFHRITEALNQKGIYYAHRKVIVDFPGSSEPAVMSEEQKQKVLEAAAAAALAAEQEQTGKSKDNKQASDWD